VADLLVYGLQEQGLKSVDKVTKPELARILITDMSTSAGVSPVGVCLQRLALSLSRCFSGQQAKLDLPRRTLPLEA